ncbi:MAG: hypothetical protein PHP54_01720 [Clostridia bacterium]|nr:hypothetical protein [Clostridia bacterium]
MSNIKENIVIKKKFNIKNIISDYGKYYKEKLLRKHIICFVIMIIIFAVSFNMFYQSASSADIKELITENYKLKDFADTFGEKSFLAFIVIFAGFTPFLYISVIGLFYGYSLSNVLVATYVMNGGNLALLIIGVVIEMIGISLCVATGMNYCKISGKRTRYSSNASYGFHDFKKAYYNLRKNKEGMEREDKKKKQKQEEKQKLNVKVPYLMFAISFAISIVFILIGMLIK